MIVGLFGKIGSGKTMIGTQFCVENPDWIFINSDKIVRELKTEPTFIYGLKQISNSLVKDDNIDNESLRTLLFTNDNPTLKTSVNEYFWGAVDKVIDKLVSNSNFNYLIETIFIAHSKIKFDLIVKLDIKESTLIERVAQRDKRDIQEIKNILNQQRELDHYKFDHKIESLLELTNILQK